MTTLLDISIPRTLDSLVARFRDVPPTRLEAWVFENAAARHATQQRLAVLGIQATIRSAYKPLVHCFLEEIDLDGIREITIQTPRDAAQRFQLDAYPLAGLFPDVTFSFVPGDDDRHYVVSLPDRTFRVFAPNTSDLSPCGWLRIWRGEQRVEDGPLTTEFEAAFASVMDAVRHYPWSDNAPYFETLYIEIETGGIEERLSYLDECISTREALHEDLYFSINEFFQKRAGLPFGDRTLQLGQIIPDIRATDGDTRIRMELRPYPQPVREVSTPVELDEADAPLTWAQAEAELSKLGGIPFRISTREGREVSAIHIEGALPGLVISGGQHANETSGVVGALRAAHALKQRADAHFALIPIENPDGLALHQQLRKNNPRHMLHAARYTALGDDLEARQNAPFGEKAARLEAIERTGAGLHISMHGYPAHEWTRPFSGYIPRGYEMWTIPKGLFLILRHHANLDGMAFMQALTAKLIESEELAAVNAGFLRVWRQHVGEMPIPIINGIPCLVFEDHRSTVPFTLVTEFPDETIYGAPFRFAHTTQMRAVVIAAELYWAGMLPVGTTTP